MTKFKGRRGWDFPIELDVHGWSSDEEGDAPAPPPVPVKDNKIYPSLPTKGVETIQLDYPSWAATTMRQQQASFELLRAKLKAAPSMAPLYTGAKSPQPIPSAETYKPLPTTPKKKRSKGLPETEKKTSQPRPETSNTGITPQLSRIRLEQEPASVPPIRLPNLAPKPTASWSLTSPLEAIPVEREYVELVSRNPYQAYLNNNVSYYVQWELERQLSLAGLTWDKVQFEDLELLRGVAVTAMPSVPLVVHKVAAREAKQAQTGFSTVPARTLIEIDQEEASIMDQDLRGVHNDSRDWPFGGKLMLAVNMDYNTNPATPPCVASSSKADNPFSRVWPFNMQLQPIEMPGRSSRLARRFGSRRLLYLRFGSVPRQQRDLVLGLLRGHGLVLFGRVFRALYIPTDSDTAIAIQVDEEAPGAPAIREPKVFPFLKLLESYNDLYAKPSQAMAKWAARLQLVMSDSVPVARVEADMITVAPDIVCFSAANPTDPAAFEILSDGCGLMSSRLAQKILHHPFFADLRWPPCAVQMRLGGSKGVLTLMSEAQEKEYGADVVLRPSMIKSEAAADFANDPSLLTLDVLKVDGLKVGGNLSSEAAVIIEERGVPAHVLISKVELEFEKIRENLSPMPHPGENEDDIRDRLLHAVYTLGGVGSERERRRCRQLGKSMKVAGLSIESAEHEEAEDDASAAEKLYRCLQSGLLPHDSMWMSQKLKFMVKMLTDRAVSDFKLPIEQSLTAMIVPDTLGVLQPDEIYVAPSSATITNPRTLRPMHCIEGEVLIYRSPCKLPTDVRKMKAVYHPKLKHLQDCIVMSADSAMCSFSPASLLAGGDYDGDTATVIWDGDLVEPFNNAPGQPMDEKKFQAENFDKEVVAVADFLHAVEGHSEGREEEARMKINLQHFLLGGIMDQQLTSRYSAMHDFAVYTLGPSHPETIRLAHMFGFVLDSRKSGLKVKPEVLKSDLQRYGSREVFWRKFKKGQVDGEYNVTYATRPKGLPEFIMDKLYAAARSAQLDVLRAFEAPKCPDTFSNLVEEFAAFKETREDEETNLQLSILTKHVHACLDLLPSVYYSTEDISEAYTKRIKNGRFYKRQPWSQTDGGDDDEFIVSTPSGTSPPKSSKLTSADIQKRLNSLRELWTSLPKPAKIPRLAALGSNRLEELKILCCIDICVRSRRPVKLPFELDLNTICKMVAQSIGSTVTITEECERDLRPKRFRRE